MKPATKQVAMIPPQYTFTNAKSYQGKENISSMAVVALDRADKDKPLKEIVTVKWFRGKSRRSSNVYCNVWVRTDCYCSGTGVAGGYGYHKNSAALQYALTSAGVTLTQPIDGGGDSATREALTAIAKAMGYTTILIVET